MEKTGRAGSDCCWALRRKRKELASANGESPQDVGGENGLGALKGEEGDLPHQGFPREQAPYKEGSQRRGAVWDMPPWEALPSDAPPAPALPDIPPTLGTEAPPTLHLSPGFPRQPP